MGVTLDYKTRAPIVAKVREAIQAEVHQLSSNHDWWCEPIWFCELRGKESELEGWNKIYLPGYTTNDGVYVEVDFEDDQLMAYRDTTFILDRLTTWSREHNLDWEISLAGEPIGNITRGEWDSRLRETVESMRGEFAWPGSLEERSREISAKYASRN